MFSPDWTVDEQCLSNVNPRHLTSFAGGTTSLLNMTEGQWKSRDVKKLPARTWCR